MLSGNAIPADLVKRLISDGNGARLGGAIRPMSVMFIDLAGFTGMSERLGDRIIPLLSRYFDSVSVQIQNQNGTIDKFIGDAAMAFCAGANPTTPSIAAGRPWRAGARWRRRGWSATMASASRFASASIQATCWSVSDRSAAELHRDRRRGEYCEPAGEHQQGVWLHDHHRPETRRLAGKSIVVRELDRLAVYGRAGGLQIYELLDIMAGEFDAKPDWVASYEAGLAAWRARDFKAAIAAFGNVLEIRDDAASSAMIERCRQQLENPAGDWDGTTVARTK